MSPFVGSRRRLAARRAGPPARRPPVPRVGPFDAPPVTITYGELGFRTRNIAGGLAARGVRAGDRVLLHLDNGPGAAVRLVRLRPPRRRGRHHQHALGRTRAGVLRRPRRRRGRRHRSRARRPRHHPRHGRCGGRPSPATSPGARWRTATRTPAPARPVDPAAPMSVIYTSGTTSRPKGVLWTHANALWGARSQRRAPGPAARTTCTSCCCRCSTPTRSVLLGRWRPLGRGDGGAAARFSARRFWRAALKHRCTWASSAASAGKALAAQPSARDHTSALGNAWCEPPTDASSG